MTRLTTLLALLGLLVGVPAHAAQPIVVYSGTVASGGLTLFTTQDMTEFNACNLVSTTGSVQLEVSYDNGANWHVHSLEDKGGISLEPVLVTTENKPYAWVGFAKLMRVVSNGAGATAVLRCGRIG